MNNKNSEGMKQTDRFFNNCVFSFRKILGKCLSAFWQFLIFLLIFLVFLEMGSFAYITYFNRYIPLPTYSFVNADSEFWVCIDKNFGVWHAPNSKYLHNKSCFVVQYQANSLGMRDQERTRKSASPRVVVLGDSFIEGWGNELGDRLSNRLEKSLNCEVLNFGTSGGFGTIQEWQQYKHFVSTFDHEVLLLGILPHNDFTDNDYEHRLSRDDDNYSPFLVGTYPDYKLVYEKESLPEDNQGFSPLKSFDFTLREWSSLYRVLRYMGSYVIRNNKLVPRRIAEFDDEAETELSMYYEYSEKSWSIMRYSLEQIMLEAQGKKVIVFTIPVYPDFTMHDGGQAPLSRALRDLSEREGFVYVDLLEEMSARHVNTNDIFFDCDNHWNAYGNAVAAGILEPYVRAALESAPLRQ